MHDERKRDNEAIIVSMIPLCVVTGVCASIVWHDPLMRYWERAGFLVILGLAMVVMIGTTIAAVVDYRHR